MFVLIFVSEFQIGALTMQIVEHELKKYQLWKEELARKKLALDILSICCCTIRVNIIPRQLTPIQMNENSFSEADGPDGPSLLHRILLLDAYVGSIANQRLG